MEACVLPASFTQQARYVRSRDGLVRDNVVLAWRLEGELDAAALERAVEEIRRRHEALRTAIRPVGGRIRQVVQPPANDGLAVRDLTDRPPSRRWRLLVRLAADEHARPFALARPHPLRVRLVRLAERTHVLLLSATHAFWDGWSTDVFLRELDALYGAFAASRDSPLPDLPIQLGDYVAWQARARERVRRRSRLLNLNELPTPAGPGRLERERVPLSSRPLAIRLHELAAAGGTTRSTALLAAFAFVLSRAAGTGSVTVALLEANREQQQARALIGCLASYAFVRVGPPATGFLDLLRTVHAATVEARARGLSLERLFPSPGAALSPRGEAPFDVIFNDLSQQATAESLGSLRLRACDLPAPANQPADAFWHRASLALNVMGAPPGGLDALVVYRSDRLARRLALCIGRDMRALLSWGVHHPRRPIPAAIGHLSQRTSIC